MIVAVDTSALAKILVEEAESAELRQFLRERATAGDSFLVSGIATVELRRLAIRLDLPGERAQLVLQRFREIRVTEAILALAAHLPARNLGTLDAIHVATALATDSRSLVTYDRAQGEAAESEGLRVLSPGQLSSRA